MQWFKVFDTQTGKAFNALASDIAGAQRLQAIETAKGVAGRRGTVVPGTRYTINSESFDVALHMEAIQGSQPSRSERAEAARVVYGEVYADNWHRQFSGACD